MKTTLLTLSFISLLQFLSFNGFCQQSLVLETDRIAPHKVMSIKDQVVNLNFSFNQLNFDLFETNTESFTTVEIEGFGKTYTPGTPDLPVYVKLLAVPVNTNLSLENITFISKDFDLLDFGQANIIKPATASLSKSDDPKKVKYTLGESYFKDAFSEDSALTLKLVGIMRDAKIYELTYKPLIYNAVKNVIKTRQIVSVDLVADNLNFNTSNWIFDDPGVQINAINEATKSAEQETFVIVSPIGYKATLQSFIKWKKQLGFNVIEAYIGEQIASNSNTLIKTYLKDLYVNPAAGVQKPKYILIVGDVAEIPTWNGVTDSHVTDLNYAEYTGDFLPEVYYGRFSIATNEELITMINKTLFVEKAVNGNFDFQNNHLLVSGVDSDYAPVYGNGAIRYFLKYYSHADFGITPKYYLYGSGSPITSNNTGAKQAILNDFSAGTGIAYYTAHCSTYGWSSPSFGTSDIPSISNKDMYPLMIGNCCESLKFNSNSFGEAIVRVKDKGAVAYIGASDFSYWDEDYYWGVGFTTNIVNDPVYENTGLGSFDAWFHSHNEPVSKHIYTTGEILNVGNLAVQASSSQLKNYYWEVYHILGDPSLVPAKFKNTRINAQYQDFITVGQNTFTVATSPSAKISLTNNSTVIAFGVANEEGLCELTFEPLTQIGEKLIELVVSKPDNAPIIDSLNVIAPDGPYLVYKGVVINDNLFNNNGMADFGENISLHFNIQNFGTEAALNSKVVISTNSEWIIESVIDQEVEVGIINIGQLITSTNGLAITLKNNVPNNEILPFVGKIICNDSLITNFEFSLTVNAPLIDAISWKIDEQGVGNLNGTIDASETVSIMTTFSNLGSAQISNTLIIFESENDQQIEVLIDTLVTGGFNALQEKILELRVVAGADIFHGDIIQLNYKVLAGDTHQYLFSGSIPLVMGSQPSFIMSNSNVEIITGYFYDSGGSSQNYSNSENYTMTFKPHKPNEGLAIEFLSFDVEPSGSGCYDKFYVYDGANTDAVMLGMFCNTNIINSFQSQNESGALTFKFTSDMAVTKAGWKAYISSSKKYDVKFKITDGVELIDSALVQFGNSSDTTFNGGEVVFENILSAENKQLIITKPGYLTLNMTIGELSSDTTITLLLQRLPDICFTISEGINLLDGVKIQFDNRTLYTNNNGFANFVSVEPGSKLFKLSKSGYIDTTGILVVDEVGYCTYLRMSKIPTFTIHFNLTDEYGALANADISINDSVVQTNASGEAEISGLLSGLHNYSVTKSGYIAFDSSVFISNDTILAHKIKHISYNVTFTVRNNQSLIAGAQINMAGKSIITNNQGIAVFEQVIPDDEITFTVSHSDFITYTGNFALVNENVSLFVDMLPLRIDESVFEIKLYPNPVKGEAELKILSPFNIDELKLFDFNGAILINKTDLPDEFSIGTQQLKPGIYLVQLKVNGKIYNEKIIIQ